MKNNIWNILLYALVFILQVLICNYLDVGAYIYICLIPLLILGIPLKTNINITILAGFGTGLLLDVFSGGVLGLNAAAATMVAAFKGIIYDKLINRDHRYNTETPSISSIGLESYLLYLTVCTLIYLLIYTFLECLGVRPFFFILFRIILSLIIDVALAVIISNSILDKDSSN